MGAAVGIGAAGASVRFIGATDSIEQANEALAIAREVDDPALLARALTACGGIAVCDAELARPYFAEALELARASADSWRLSHILVWRAYGAAVAGDPITAHAVGEEGRDPRRHDRRPVRLPWMPLLGPGCGADDAGQSGRSRRTVPRGSC